MPLERHFEKFPEPTRITKTQLIHEMQRETGRHNQAVEIAITDFVDDFCSRNPQFSGKEEFFKLFFKAEPRTPEEEIRIEEFFRQMRTTPEELRMAIMHTYANMNNYTIVQEG